MLKNDVDQPCVGQQFQLLLSQPGFFVISSGMTNVLGFLPAMRLCGQAWAFSVSCLYQLAMQLKLSVLSLSAFSCAADSLLNVMMPNVK